MKLILVIAFSLLSAALSAAPVTFDSHRIQVTLDVPAHTASITDSGSLVTNVGWNWFFINKSAQVHEFTLNSAPCVFKAFNAKDSVGLPAEVRSQLANGAEFPEAQLISFESSASGTTTFKISYTATFDEDVANVRFSREAVGREVSGTILDKGAYLSPSSYFYPQGKDNLATFALVADIPAGWESVSDGNAMASFIAKDRKVQVWENPYKSDGSFFMAAPYVALSTMADSTEVTCLFFEADTSLAPNYLKATADYVKMYSDLIGPYPFNNFTVAENFFPTGYGMPGWTLLGQSVLRLPFIIGSSLGHEVLHNWWGNSVYVDYSRGNWCEGLTVYGADYRYKLNESPSAAKEYRKDILKQYVTYVSKDKDFPLREFTSRTSPNTRAVGYNKAMMVFHMIEAEIGTPAFFDAWRLVYRTYIGRQVGWEEWLQAFETTSRKDLSTIIPEWINRAGAPEIGVDISGTAASAGEGTKKVKLTITQKGSDLYHLRIPITIQDASARRDTTVTIERDKVAVELLASEGATIAIDPDYHLFRRLYPEEVEPIISAVLGAPKQEFVIGNSNGTLDSAFEQFATGIAEDSATIIAESGLNSLSTTSGLIWLNPKSMPEFIAGQIVVSVDSVIMGAGRFPREGHSFFLSGQSVDGVQRYWVILTDDAASLPRLGQLVPHYGKYSYLVFQGAKNIAKGQWEVSQTPLRVVVK